MNTTRRALVGTALALPALAITPLKDERIVPRPTSRGWIEQIAALHPNGRQVALYAHRADVDWDRLYYISMEGPTAPVLHFKQREGSRGYPKAEIMVSTNGAWLHGPVEAL